MNCSKYKLHDMDDKRRPLTIAEKNRQKALDTKEQQNAKLEQKIAQMPDKEITEELKKKGVPTFGTKAEREARLRKAYGLGGAPQSAVNHPYIREPAPQSAVGPGNSPGPVGAAKPATGKTLSEIERIKQKREERRKEQEKNVRLQSFRKTTS